MMNTTPFEQENGKWTIVRRVGGTRGHEGYKTVFPHEMFESLYEARLFLFEKGLLATAPLWPRPQRYYPLEIHKVAVAQ